MTASAGRRAARRREPCDAPPGQEHRMIYSPAKSSEDFALPSQGTIPERVAQGWNRFWFNPVDPTTLGLVRIFVGLLVFYVHLVYSFDLQRLFGKDAWLNVATINDFRENEPIYEPPAEWEPSIPQQSQPLTPQQQEYRLKWGDSLYHFVGKGHYFWSIWFHLTDPFWMAVVHVACLVVFVLLTVGFCTRVTSVLSFLAAMSYIQRAPTTLFGMDTIMAIALIYLSIGASGAALSVDRWLTLRWARRAGKDGSSAGFLYPPAQTSANFALRLMQVHICII